MNCNELNKRVMTVMQYGVAPLVTKYLQEHPEYFTDCISYPGKICQYEITLSFQPEKVKDIATAKPSIFIRLGGIEKCHELDCFNHHPEDLYSRFKVDGSTVSDQEIPNV